MKISQDQYNEFLKDFAWQRLKTPDYRLGQAFCNFFSKEANQILGTIDEFRLYYATDEDRAQELINKCINDE
jgi:hypothetical protein